MEKELVVSRSTNTLFTLGDGKRPNPKTKSHVNVVNTAAADKAKCSDHVREQELALGKFGIGE